MGETEATKKRSEAGRRERESVRESSVIVRNENKCKRRVQPPTALFPRFLTTSTTISTKTITQRRSPREKRNIKRRRSDRDKSEHFRRRRYRRESHRCDRVLDYGSRACHRVFRVWHHADAAMASRSARSKNVM